MTPENTIGSIVKFLAISLSIWGFQQGLAQACSTDKWSVHTGSTVTPESEAVYEGKCGLRLNLDGTSSGMVTDATLAEANPAVTDYVARFYAYVDDAYLDNDQGFTLFNALDASLEELFGLELKGGSAGPVLQLYAGDKNASAVPAPLGWRAIIIERTSDRLSLWVDREKLQTISGLNNAGQSIDAVNLGMVSGNTAEISGIIDIDAFTSRRTGAAGMSVSKSCSGTEIVKNTTFLPGPAITCRASQGLSFGDRVTFDPGANVIVQAGSTSFSPGISIPNGAVLEIQIQ